MMDKNVKITVEYTIQVPEKFAYLIADIAKNHGPSLASDNFSIWEFNPEEKVVSAEVV